MKVKIVVDSACDLPREIAQRLDRTVVSTRTIFGRGEYLDGINLTTEQFYEKMEETDARPTTSQPPPADYAEAFEKALEDGDVVVCLTPGAKLSGCCQSAHIAAEPFGDKVMVVDSETVTIGEQLLVLRAVKLRDDGLSAQEIVDQLNREKKQVRMLALLDTLEYLKKGGRISSAVAFAGTLLSIKPIVGIRNSELSMISKARGMRNGGRRLMELIRQGKGINFEKPFVLAHTGLSDLPLRKFLEDFSEMIESKVEMQPLCRIGSTIGAHAGPGAIGLAYFEKE